MVGIPMPIGGASGELVEVDFKLWGAAGGTDDTGTGAVGELGGHGGYVEGGFWLPAGTKLVLQVGQGGINGSGHSNDTAYPNGGLSNGAAYAQGGGGRSAIFMDSVLHANAIAVAGGGGGSGYHLYGYGGSGGANSGNGEDSGTSFGYVAGGGTQSAGGVGQGTGETGAALEGGDCGVSSGSNAGPGGGDGYYGGGGGVDVGSFRYGGAGGGSNFIRDFIKSTTSTGTSSNSSTSAPNSGDPDYVAGVAQAVLGSSPTRGGNGLIVLTVDGVKTVYSYTGADVEITL